MPKTRRTYAGAAVSTSIATGIDADDLIITLTESTGWASGYFYAVLDPGTASEEKVLVSSRSGASLTVSARGVDGTTAKSHIAGAIIYPVHAAVDSDEANELTSTYSATGGIVYQGASTFAQLPIGTAGQVLKVNSGATAPEWGTIGSGAIADGAVTEAALAVNAVTSGKIANGAVGADDLASNSVTTVKIADANVTTAKIADSNITTAKILNGTILSTDLDYTTAVASGGNREIFVETSYNAGLGKIGDIQIVI